jgi:hypothetical protein
VSRNLSILNSNRRTGSFTAGFLVGAISFGLAHGLTLLSGLESPSYVLIFVAYLLAGSTLAICSTESFRGALTLRVDAVAQVQRAFFCATAAYVLFLVPTLWLVPEFPLRWLALFFALEILLDWLAWRLPLKDSAPTLAASRAFRLATYLDSNPQAPFVIAGLVLLTFTPILLMAGQNTAAERIATWAFVFFVASVGVSLINFISWPDRLRQVLRQFPQTLVFIVFFSSLAFAFALSNSEHTKPEMTYLVDVHPSYVASRISEGDMIFSDSPSLRLWTIPNLSTHLDLRPDNRGPAVWDDLINALKDVHRVFWVSVPNDSSDTQQLVSTFLKSNGCLDDLPGLPLPVRLYELRKPLIHPRVLPPRLVSQTEDDFDPADVDLGSIRMTGFRFESTVCSHDAVAVAIRWKVNSTAEPLKVSLMLADAQDRLIQTQDFFIDDPSGNHTDHWTADKISSTYNTLVVPSGTPPGKYKVSAAVYKANDVQRLSVVSAQGVAKVYADFVTLGQVLVYRAEDLSADPYKTVDELGLDPARVLMREGLMLDSYKVSSGQVLTGEDLAVVARWNSLLDTSPPYDVLIRLQRDGIAFAQASGPPVDGTYPTDQWRAGEWVLDRRDLRVPPDAQGGPARLEIGLEGGKLLYVADINVVAPPHTFKIPPMRYSEPAALASVAELIGYDLDQAQVSAHDQVGLTLYWRAIASPVIDKNYKVFVQLLASDGHLIAQSDRVPADGARPTRGWVNGEIVADSYQLEIKDSEYRGDAQVIVGIYNPVTLVRVPLLDSSNDFIKLRTPIHISAR